MTNMAKPLRLYVTGPVYAGADIVLSPDQTHYVLRVMRRKDGDPLLLFNGQDGEWRGHLQPSGKKDASVFIHQQTRPQELDPDLWLLFAPVKKNAIDFIVQKATELGVARLSPVTTEQTNSRRINTERLSVIAIEAAEQSHRLSVPEVRTQAPLAQAVNDWSINRPLYLLDETGNGTPIAEQLAADADQSSNNGAFIMGPEGGFTKAELDLLRRLPFVKPVSLGPRILRAETAALAALTCWQALCGDWRTSSR